MSSGGTEQLHALFDLMKSVGGPTYAGFRKTIRQLELREKDRMRVQVVIERRQDGVAMFFCVESHAPHLGPCEEAHLKEPASGEEKEQG